MADEPADEITTRILDAATRVLETSGLRRCTVEEIAERGNVGRTTIYRRFDGRDDIVHAVLARELRTFLLGVAESVGHLERLEDKLVRASSADCVRPRRRWWCRSCAASPTS
jgi:AcrR family transcriptional regulator